MTATNSRPTDELMEAVARNMRRTIYVLGLKFDFVRDPSLRDRSKLSHGKLAQQVAVQINVSNFHEHTCCDVLSSLKSNCFVEIIASTK